MRYRRAVLLVAMLAACDAAPTSHDDDDAQAPPSTLGGGAGPIDPFASDAGLATRVNALFGSSCLGGPEASCHGNGAAGLSLRLGPGGDVVGVRSTERPDLVRVRPFDPPASYLFLKVRGDTTIDGGRMPLGEKEEDPRIADLVGRWIEAGAPSP